MTELVMISRPAMDGTIAEVSLALSEVKALLATLQASMVQSQVTEYAACRRLCRECGLLQPLNDRRTRRVQTLFCTVAVPRFRVCRCHPPAPTTAVALSPAAELLNDLVNAYINKQRQMRWLPLGALRLLQVRAAVLDGRFGQHAALLSA